jgi:hypothetical protein
MLVLCCVFIASAQSSEELLSKRMSIHFKKATVLQILSHVSSREDTPIGFEPSLSDHSHEVMQIDVDNASLEDILNLLVQNAPRYRWRYVDGAINVTAVTDQDPVISRLLSLPIKSFETPINTPTLKLMDAVLRLPEVAEFLNGQGLTGSSAANMSIFLQPDPIRSSTKIMTSNVEFRAVLNKTIVATQNRLWIAYRNGEKLDQVHILF